MSEINKLYENAGVKKQIPKVCSSNELYCKECKAHIEDAMSYCKNAEYPPFTAEKQIELIKWLSEHYLLEIRRIKDTQEYYIGFNGYKKRVWNATMNFENTLAKLINNFWQELTEIEKQQVKGILE